MSASAYNAIHGRWFSAGSSRAHEATIEYNNGHYTLTIEGDVVHSGTIASLDIAHRIADIDRNIIFTDQSLFVSPDNDSIDKMSAEVQHPFFSWLHAQESSITRIIISIVLTAVLAVSFVQFGIPWGSKKIAYIIPKSTVNLVSNHTLGLLDDYYFDPSELSTERQQALVHDFTNNILPALPRGQHYQLYFRRFEINDTSIANAFALPNGDIIITDKLVDISNHNDELSAILLHEAGHVVHKHSMQALVQQMIISMTSIAILGQTDGISDAAVGMGSLLMANGYSRTHEKEADTFALQHMLSLGINPKHFASILTSIQQEMTNPLDEKKPDVHPDTPSALSRILATHPDTTERIQRAQLFEQCFQTQYQHSPQQCSE